MEKWDLDIQGMDSDKCDYKKVVKEMDNDLCRCKKHDERNIVICGNSFGICSSKLCPHKK